MASAAELAILISAKDQASPALKNVGAALGNLDRQAKSTGSGLSVLGSGLAGATAKAGLMVFGVKQIADAAGATGRAMFGFNASMEQTKVAMTTMLGSTEKASAMLGDLQRFAATTPFEFPELADASRKMLAFGFSAEKVLPMMRSIGDAVSALGGGSFEINRVTTALGQMQAKGKVSAQEMMQLTEVGIPAWEILAKKIGVSTSELMRMTERGLIPASVAVDALVEGMGTKFAGAMDAQSKTFVGLMSTLRDTANMTLGRIMEPAFEVAKVQLEKLVAFTNSAEFSRWADDMAKGAERIAVEVGDFLANEGPALVKTFGDASVAALTLAGDIAGLVAKANAVNDALGGEGWKMLLAGAAGAKVGGPVGAAVAAGAVGAQGMVEDRQKGGQSGLAAVMDTALDVWLHRVPGQANSATEAINALGAAWAGLKDHLFGGAEAAVRINDLLAEEAVLVAQADRSVVNFNSTWEQALFILDNTTSAMKANTAESHALAQAFDATAAAQSALSATMDGLSNAYQTNLGFQKVLSSANSEYKSQVDAIENAVKILQERQAEGIPLTAQELSLLGNKDALLGRLKGGIDDNTVSMGLAAAANVELMHAQDELNGMLSQGITKGEKFDEATRNVQSALENARMYGFDPSREAAGKTNQVMSELQGLIKSTLVPALEGLKEALQNLKAPPPIEIQIASAAAIAEINRIKALIASGAYMPMYITPQQAATGYAGGTASAPKTMVARINEIGPELAVLPYAGAYAAGGTVGFFNGGRSGYAVVPKGTEIIPAAQTRQMLGDGFTSLEGGIASDGSNVYVYVEMDGERVERRINVRQYKRQRRAIVPGERF